MDERIHYQIGMSASELDRQCGIATQYDTARMQALAVGVCSPQVAECKLNISVIWP